MSVIEFDSRQHEFSGNTEALAWLLREFAKRDENFLQRYALNKPERMKRSIIARNRDELYPDRPDLALDKSKSYEFLDGWFLVTNTATRNVKQYIELACNVFGVVFGRELKIRISSRG